MFISNWDLRETVKRAADRTVFDAVHEAVCDEVRMTVYWSVSGALHVSLFWPVRGAVGWAVDEDLPHPALQDYLKEAGVA
jgi:hypothetical protein